MAKDRMRTAKEVIDQAIAENKWNEWLLYAFAIVFVISGAAVLVLGMIQGEGVVSLAGSITTALFYPAMQQARQIRRENIAIRLLEQPLSMAETAKEAADTLREFFETTFIKKAQNSGS